MRNRLHIFLAIASLALAALACQAVTGAQDVPTVEIPSVNTIVPVDTVESIPTDTEEPVENSSSGTLLQDDFSGGRTTWGTGTDADSAVEYVEEALNMQVFTKNYFVWTTPNDKEYDKVHMEVTVINNGTDSTTAFGLICYKQYPIDQNNYYFAVTPAGEYAIAKAALAQDDVFLTNNNEWAKSDLIAKDAASYRIGADCGNGTLTLYVDGQQIDSISDSTYTNGGIAIFAWSGKEATTTNVSFDDFMMTKLP